MLLKIYPRLCVRVFSGILSTDFASRESKSNGKFGRPEANVIEPTEFSLGRVYKVQWKKERPNLEELARLYWVEGLTQLQVAKAVGVRRVTVAMAAKEFKLMFASEKGG